MTENINENQKELSLEECEVISALEYYSPPFTLKMLTRAAGLAEDKVREILRDLDLLDVVSRKRIAERKRIQALAQQAHAAEVRAAEAAALAGFAESPSLLP